MKAAFNQLKECRYGKVLYNINDLYIGRSFDLYGEFSQLELDFLGNYLKPGNLVLDIGANIGSHSLFFAQKVQPNGLVLAFEPQRLVFQTLCANVALNSLINVFTFNVALGENEGHLKVPLLDFSATNNFGGLSLEAHDVGEMVRATTIDSLNLSRCDFIKIDVEGMELAVLKGAQETIAKFKPIIYLENDRPHKAQALCEYLLSIGYVFQWHKPPLFNPNNFFANPQNVFGSKVSINMLCIAEA